MRGYRKLSVALIGVIGTQGLCALGVIDGGVYSTVVIAITGAYPASNVVKGSPGTEK